MKAADRLKARFAVVIGDDELARSAVQVKDLSSGEQEEVDMNQLVDYIRSRIRREFKWRIYTEHTSGELRTEQVGERVRLNGWVHNRRDLGGVIFLDVRDRSGIVQVVCNPKKISEEAADLADKLRNEYVVAIEGEVVERDPDTVNPNLPTGKIKVRATTIQLLTARRHRRFPSTSRMRM